MKKILSLILSVVMVCSLATTAFATDISEADKGTEVPVELTQAATAFSVTVPTSLPVSVSSSGVVTVPIDNRIINDSYGPVEVKGVEVSPIEPWTLVDYATDFTQKKVGITEFGYQINGVAVATDGSCAAEFDVIDGGSEISFTYNVNVAAQASALENVSIANVVFTIGWYGESSSTGDDTTGGGSTDGDITDGGSTDGDITDGDITDGGSTDGDSTGDSTDDTTTTTYASTFADNSWSDIISAVQNDAVPSTWSVGDIKSMTIDGTEYNVQIIGKNHDTYSDGGTAPLTFQLVECYAKYQMNSTHTNSTGWSGSAMRTTHLNTILSAMPSEVQSAIKSVNKSTLNGAKTGLETTSDKLFLLSEIEVLGSTSYSNGYSEGSQYAFYANGGSPIKYFEGSVTWWWLRGPCCYGNTNFSGVYDDGSLTNYIDAANDAGVSFGFCF